MTERRVDHLDAATIAALVDRTLDAAARRDAEAHLAACADCREVWVETSEMAELPAAEAAPGPGAHVVVARPVSRRAWIYGGAAVAAAVALMVGFTQWQARQQEGTAVLLEQVINASARQRFTEGRLSLMQAWEPLPSARRGADEAGLPIVNAAIEEMSDRVRTEGSARGFHHLGVAHLAAGRLPDAIRYLEQAVRGAPGDSEANLDLSAALLERCRESCTADEAERALRAATAAFEATRSPAAAFNRALALERASRPGDAARSWQEYLTIETDANWRAEALAHLNQGR